MTESFIMNAFHKMGEQPQTVKVMRNRYTGEPAGYCFVHFPTDEMALDAMHKLNGKIIPGSSPVSFFRREKFDSDIYQPFIQYLFCSTNLFSYKSIFIISKYFKD